MKGFFLPVFCLWILVSCTRKEIEFGTIPENAYTNLAYIDTVTAQLSTVLTDSFSTTSDTSFLVGRYSDPYLGTVTAKPFFQFAIPSSVPDIASSAVFDSLELIIRLNKYYYGDTSKLQTITVRELAEPIVHTYNSYVFNTSNFATKPVALGSKTLRISPNATDSFSVRLSNDKGLELFNKLRQRTSDILTQSEFINYLYGINISVADSDTSGVFGLNGAAGSFVIRVHYHGTIPLPEAGYIDFTSLANEYAFTQVKPDRASTGLVPLTPGLSEIFPAATNGRVYLQPGTGLSLKMIFPTLKSILNRENNGLVKLLKAELIIKPKYLSSDLNKYKLPASLGLAQTDATNLVGSSLSDSTGMNTLSATPVIDEVYGINNYYRFNVTNYINALLTTVGSEKTGFYLLQQASVARSMDRLVVEASGGKEAGVMLLLYVLNINN